MKYVVISAFNGMGCCFVALEQAGIEVSQKISSEVDKWAIKSNDAMYPDTIQVGDVRKIEVIKDENGKPIQLKTENGIIDLLDDEIILAGGSPCQSFSMAGKMKGMVTKDELEVLTLEHYLKLKEQEFEFEGQSYLFWEYMRLKNELNPKYFILENVIMVEKWYNVLTRAIGLNAIRINAALVGAQNRDRYFWTNIYTQPQGLFGDMECMIPQPKDRGILLKDILEKDVPEKYFLKDNHLKWWKENEDFQLKKGYSSLDADKGITQTARQYASWNGNFVSGESNKETESNAHIKFGRTDEGKKIRKNSKKTHGKDYSPHQEKMITDLDFEKTGTLTSVTKDNLIMQITTNKENENTDPQCVAMRGRNPDNPNDRTSGAPTEQRIEPRTDGKTNTLTTVQKDNLVREIITYNIPEIVSVRKHEVDIIGLQKCLKKHKKGSIKKIAEALAIPKTNAEHWFRTDSSFSIPDADIWDKLKSLLKIETDEFDKSIIEFEEREGSFEKANRVYDEEGIAPTLTSASANEKILVREKENYIQWDGNGFDQDNRAYYEDGKAGTLDTKGNRTKVLLNEEPKAGEDKKSSKGKKSQVEKVLDKTGLDISKVTEPTILDVYNKKLKEDGKCITLTDPCHNNLRLVVPGSYPPDYPEYMKPLESEITEDETGSNAYWERITKYEKENNIIKNGPQWPSPRSVKQINPSTESGDKQPYQQNRVYHTDGISPALCADKSDLLIKGGDFRAEESCRQLASINSRIRRLTPRECGRLQTFPEDKLDILLKSSVSDSQLYRQFGNGWCVSVISHIFSYIK